MEVPYSWSCYLCYSLITREPSKIEFSTFYGETEILVLSTVMSTIPHFSLIVSYFPSLQCIRVLYTKWAQWEELINHLYVSSLTFLPKSWLLHLLEMLSPGYPLLHFLQVLIPKPARKNHPWPPYLKCQPPTWQSVSLSGFRFRFCFAP